MVRPALQKLLIDVQARRIDVIVVYKVDRLTRSPTSPSWSRRSMPMASRSCR
jgi:DNA invertase Pin-like site-specific DNA recombinase